MILIVGAGLSGLLIAYRLKKEGIPFKILEARNRVGGRIHTIYETNNAPIEMGATWFTEEHQHLIALLEELDIAYFEQSMDSNVFYEASPTSSTHLVSIPSQAPSFRISGGTSSLINALVHKLDETDILLNQSVTQITVNANAVQVITEQTFECNAVVLAIPPKLWAKNIAIKPTLPIDLMRIATQTQTWMEDSIKVALTYKKPFWGHANLPGTLFSNVGPITEFYAHSNHENTKHALCGFMNPAFKNLTYIDRRYRVMNQLKNVYGEKAEEFTSYKECIWSNEENTFKASDVFLGPHQNNGNPIYNKPVFDDKLLLSSTESSPLFPGYMEGAVHSANIIAEKLTKANGTK